VTTERRGSRCERPSRFERDDRSAAFAPGIDDAHQPLLPVALTAGTHGLTVTPQARRAFDRKPL
jgi:hypothetical protein